MQENAAIKDHRASIVSALSSMASSEADPSDVGAVNLLQQKVAQDLKTLK